MQLLGSKHELYLFLRHPTLTFHSFYRKKELKHIYVNWKANEVMRFIQITKLEKRKENLIS